jgi:hypothetical protein
MRIPGTERSDIPPALADQGDEWMEDRRDSRRAKEKAKESKLATLSLMKANGIEEFTVTDPDTKEVLTLRHKVKDELVTERTHEADDLEVGEAIPKSSAPADQPHAGLIAQAEAANLGNGVSETDDGDVVPPEGDGKKPKKKGRRKS